MPYKNPARRALAIRCWMRKHRHGNWRQTYIDCEGMCVARVNGDELPCGAVVGLEFHEVWGENGDVSKAKFQQRVMLCNLHHALVEDRAHQAEFIMGQHKPSRLQEDVQIEIMLEGGYQNWVRKHELDDGRSGSLLFVGPRIDDYE